MIALDFLKDEKQRFWASVAVACVYFFAVFYLLMLPQINKMRGLNANIAKLKSETTALELDVRKSGEYEKKIAECAAKVEKYEKQLPTGERIPSLLQKLSDMAEESGTKIVSISPVTFLKGQAGQEKRPYREIPILISARSGYHQLGSFLSKLENADLFMRVADIHIIADSRTPTKHNVELLVLTCVVPEEEKRQ